MSISKTSNGQCVALHPIFCYLSSKTFYVAIFFTVFLAFNGIAQAQESVGSSGLTTEPRSTTTSTSTDVSPLSAASGSAATQTKATTSTTLSPRATTSAIVQPSRPIVKPKNVSTTTPATTLPVAEATSGAFSLPSETSSSLPLLFVFIATALVGLVAIFVIESRKKKTDMKNDDDRCETFRELLLQKKKELEDMTRNWPEEKLKAVAQEKAEKALSKNEDVNKIIDIYKESKERYDELRKAITILEQRYNLCMLEFPKLKRTRYVGILDETSFTDNKILKSIKIIAKQKKGSLRAVEVSEDDIERLTKTLNDGPWHAYFWQKDCDDTRVVFKDKSFIVKHPDLKTWADASEYAKHKGITALQLDRNFDPFYTDHTS